MAFQFPINPAVGQVFQATPQLTFKWDGTGWNPITTLPDFWIVGDIHLSMSPVNPAGRFGGTWVLISQGRFLVGVGTLGSHTYAAGDQGGAAAIALTQTEMPGHAHAGTTDAETQSHSHSTSYSGVASSGTGGTVNIVQNPGLGGAGSWNTSNQSTLHNHAFSTSIVGGGAPHENRPPYLGCYMWQKTA